MQGCAGPPSVGRGPGGLECHARPGKALALTLMYGHPRMAPSRSFMAMSVMGCHCVPLPLKSPAGGLPPPQLRLEGECCPVVFRDPCMQVFATIGDLWLLGGCDSLHRPAQAPGPPHVCAERSSRLGVAPDA